MGRELKLLPPSEVAICLSYSLHSILLLSIARFVQLRHRNVVVSYRMNMLWPGRAGSSRGAVYV